MQQALGDEGFTDVEVTRKSRQKYDFTGRKEGAACEGTATVTERSGGYQTQLEVDADWRCGR